jgi:acetyl esterase/lipase
MIHRTMPLWEPGTYPGEGEDGFQPTLATYVLDGPEARGAVLICPGGGYFFTSNREAEPIAMRFAAAGFQAFVLYYSVAPRRHPQPLLDLARAMTLIRERAHEWRVDPGRIAVCGFSAGGHLAASLGVHWGKAYLRETPGIQADLIRPNALILCYPVISRGPNAHQGSFINLLGEEAAPELSGELSLECHVSRNTPPAFIWHTFDDPVVPVENSLLFASAMRAQGIPFELHVYPSGPHGLSLATAETEEPGMGVHPHVATWLMLCVQWLEELFGGKIA